MLKEIEQTHSKVMSNTEAYRMLESLYSGVHSKLQALHKPIENLGERLTTSSTLVSKYQKACPTTGGSSLWQRYWTAILVGILSSIITSILLGGHSVKKEHKKKKRRRPRL